jgi:histidinol dehydrogenase
MLGPLDLRDGGSKLEASRPEPDPTVTQTVRAILARVEEGGDQALHELTLELDGVDLARVVVDEDESSSGVAGTSPDLRRALDGLIDRLRDLHARQLPAAWSEERDGVRFGEVVVPIRAAGCYVPGGRAVYPSSVAMTVVPAVVAGVEQVVLASPPRPDGSLPPPVLYAARQAGATRVVKVGGAQAIAAMAYGTGSVPAVDRIVGPGNAYVTEAKRQVAGRVGIDGLAGPSELALVADGSADPGLCASDMIAQAEHAPDSPTYLISWQADQIGRVDAELTALAPIAGRAQIVGDSLRLARAYLVRDEEQAAEVVDEIAPEHLQIVTADPGAFLDRVRNYGAAFLGPWSAVPFGDYGVASNHVLPTAGTARFASGLRASDFTTVRSFVQIDRDAAGRHGPDTITLAEAEGLLGHAEAIRARASGGGS